MVLWSKGEVLWTKGEANPRICWCCNVLWLSYCLFAIWPPTNTCCLHISPPIYLSTHFVFPVGHVCNHLLCLPFYYLLCPWFADPPTLAPHQSAHPMIWAPGPLAHQLLLVLTILADHHTQTPFLSTYLLPWAASILAHLLKYLVIPSAHQSIMAPITLAHSF